MSRSTYATVATTLALGLLAALPGTSTAAPVCGPANAKTIKQAGDVRVYRHRSGDYAAYGCMRGVGRSFRLEATGVDPIESEESAIRREPIAIAGRFVAFVSDGSGGDGASDFDYTSVDRVDLRTGKRRYSSCTDWLDDEEDDGCATGLKVTGLVLRRTGGYAYLQRLTTAERRVHRVDPRGHVELDRGRDVELRSLRLEGTRLSWHRAGTTMTASLR